MIRPKAYLAGAIAGLQFDAATDWRHQAAEALAIRGIECLNPMRAKNALSTRGRISTNCNDYANEGPFFVSRGIMTRDFNDVQSCDALLVNLLGLTKPSMGTVMELGWGFALKKPTIVLMEKSGNPHDNHPMILETIGFRVETMDEAIDTLAVVLNR